MKAVPSTCLHLISQVEGEATLWSVVSVTFEKKLKIFQKKNTSFFSLCRVEIFSFLVFVVLSLKVKVLCILFYIKLDIRIKQTVSSLVCDVAC